MNQVFNAIKCHHCQEILKTPVIYPCGHSMCKEHADEENNQVKCPKCGVSHPKQGFAINTELQEMIASQIAFLNFGPCHKKAQEACHKLEDMLSQIDAILKDPIYFSYRTIEELKNQVHLKSEQLRFEIDEKTEQLLSVLTQYQKNCELNLEEPSMEPSMKALENSKRVAEKMLKESLDFLDRLRFDDEKWMSIKQECDSKLVDLNKQLESVKKLILLDEFKEKRDQVDFFDNIDLIPLFRMKIPINSVILDDERKTMLREMCEIKPRTKWTLLYRGSQDGYGARDFHAKCDNIPNTLTIIETTKGYIFGGYTERTWNCVSHKYARDPKAFIFSLVNDVNRSFLMKIQKPEYAIFASNFYGPNFGETDIIMNNSNTADNSSIIRSYCLPDEYKNKPHILSGSETFRVKEIEVFQLE